MASFWAGKERFLRHVAYGVRLVAGTLSLFLAFFRLTRLGDRDTKIIRGFGRFLANHGYKVRRRWSLNVVYVPLLHYARVLRSIPLLAGRDSPSYVEELEQMHRCFVESCDEHERTYLPSGIARDLQRKLVMHLFRQGLGLNLAEERAKILSCYSESTMLMCDFLGFCLAGGLVVGAESRSKEYLFTALSDFEAILRSHLRPGVQDLPPTEAFLDRSPRDPNTLSHVLQPCVTMVGCYDRSRAEERAGLQCAPDWLRDELEKHLGVLEEVNIVDVRTVLTYEMHMYSCALLCAIASVVSSTDGAAGRTSREFGVRLERLRTSLLDSTAPGWTRWENLVEG